MIPWRLKRDLGVMTDRYRFLYVSVKQAKEDTSKKRIFNFLVEFFVRVEIENDSTYFLHFFFGENDNYKLLFTLHVASKYMN